MQQQKALTNKQLVPLKLAPKLAALTSHPQPWKTTQDITLNMPPPGPQKKDLQPTTMQNNYTVSLLKLYYTYLSASLLNHGGSKELPTTLQFHLCVKKVFLESPWFLFKQQNRISILGANAHHFVTPCMVSPVDFVCAAQLLYECRYYLHYSLLYGDHGWRQFLTDFYNLAS